MQFKKVLITGGAGFIGKAAAKQLLLSGVDVVCFDLVEQIARNKESLKALMLLGNMSIVGGSVLDKTAFRQAVDGCDAVLHLAAMLGVKKTEDNKLACLEVNVTGTENVLSGAVSHGVKKFIFASSSEVYGEPNQNPINEHHDTKGKTVYAVSKLAGEELVKGYQQRYPTMNYTIVRFFNTYGEGQIAQFVLSKFVEQVKRGMNPTVYGTGKQIRSYGHVEDVAKGLNLVLSSDKSNGEIYNLGNSTQVLSLEQLADKVIEIVGNDKNLKVDILGDFVDADRNSDREIFERFCDTSKAHSHLGYDPMISVDEGIRRIAAQEKIYTDWADWI